MPDVRRAAYFLNALLAVIAAAAIWGRPAATLPPPAAVFVPERVGDWLSQGDQPLPEEARAVLASAHVVNRSYRRVGDEIDITVIAGNDRSELHDPRSCLVGAGWRIENDHVETLAGAGIPVRVCRLTRPDGDTAETYDALYFYVVDGRVVSQATYIRTEMLWSALIGRTDRTVYFLRFVQPVPGGVAGAASEDLAPFAAEVWRHLSTQIPGIQEKEE